MIRVCTAMTGTSDHITNSWRPEPEEKSSSSGFVTAAFLVLSVVALGLLYWVSHHNYLLFHVMIEGFSIVVASSLFMLAWSARHRLDNDYLLLLGVAYLFIGGIDFLHTLTYKGMGVFPGSCTNLATELWIAARYVEALTLLVAPLALRMRLRPSLTFVLYAAVSVLLVTAIFGGFFPDCFVEGQGLTPFKVASEYVIAVCLAAAAIFLYVRRASFDKTVLRLLIASIILTIGSEMSFTLYDGPYGAFNMLGHLLKLASFYLIYRAIIVTSLTRPYDLLYRRLHESEEYHRTLMKVMPSALYTCDREGRITFYNEQASALWGWRPRLGDPGQLFCGAFRLWLPDGTVPAPADMPVAQAIGQGRGIRNQEVIIEQPDGNRVHVLGNIDPLYDNDGNIAGAVNAFINISDIKEAEAMSRISRARLELLATVAERLLRSDNPQIIVEELCRMVMVHLDCQFFFNYFVEEPNRRLMLNACAGVPDDEAVKIRQLDFGVAVCGCRSVAPRCHNHGCQSWPGPDRGRDNPPHSGRAPRHCRDCLVNAFGPGYRRRHARSWGRSLSFQRGSFIGADRGHSRIPSEFRALIFALCDNLRRQCAWSAAGPDSPAVLPGRRVPSASTDGHSWPSLDQISLQENG